MEINIVGPGSMGLMLAYLLSGKNGVTLIVKEEDLPLYSKGFTVRENGAERHVTIPVSARPRDADLTIIAVKSYDLDYVMKRMNIHGRILLIQNGLTHLALDYPEEDKYYAVTTWGATRLAKGKVELTGKGYFRVGGTKSLDLGFLRKAGINAEWSENIEEEIYRKAGINSAINPLTAIFRVRNGIVTENSHLWSIAKAVIEEDQELFGKMGMHFDLEKNVIETCRSTAMNSSSMLQDVLSHRRTEIEAINGELVNMGMKSGVQMKVNRTLVSAIKFIESFEMPVQEVK